MFLRASLPGILAEREAPFRQGSAFNGAAPACLAFGLELAEYLARCTTGQSNVRRLPLKSARRRAEKPQLGQRWNRRRPRLRRGCWIR